MYREWQEEKAKRISQKQVAFFPLNSSKFMLLLLTGHGLLLIFKKAIFLNVCFHGHAYLSDGIHLLQ